MIKKIVEKDNSNLVILGKQSIDDDFNQTGQILAGLLNWPQATNASKIEIEIDNDNENNQVLVTREIDGGEDILKSKLPMIITTDLRLNEPRYASLQNIMKAKKKPLTKLKPQDLGIDKIENKLEILKIEEPPIRQAGVKVDNVDQLIEKLKELKAI